MISTMKVSVSITVSWFNNSGGQSATRDQKWWVGCAPLLPSPPPPSSPLLPPFFLPFLPLLPSLANAKVLGIGLYTMWLYSTYNLFVLDLDMIGH